jgi:hypothetical protein
VGDPSPCDPDMCVFIFNVDIAERNLNSGPEWGKKYLGVLIGDV